MFYSSSNFTIPENWEYRGEGNCHIVISLPKQRKILRVRKETKSKSLLKWFIKWITHIFQWYCGNPTDDESRDLKFYRNVIRPLLGYKFVCRGEQILLSKKQVRRLQRRLENKRPDIRKIKSLQYGRASLFDDYAFLPNDYYPFQLAQDTFSVEIKPKQGWIPLSERHFPKCIFCMHQYTKREKGQIKQLSSYCPQDLFSGDPPRVIKALESLSDNPQNNLKIFKNGHLSYGENFGYEQFETIISEIFTDSEASLQELKTAFFVFIQKCLLTNFSQDYRDCTLKKFCEWDKIIQQTSQYNKLPFGCVLERILSMQMLDVEGHQYYYKLLSTSNQKVRDYDYVKKLLNVFEDSNENACLKCAIMMLANRTDDLVYVPYLISAIAKDCSLMVSFQRILTDNLGTMGLDNIIKTKYGCFLVNIGVFDLYPKPISTIFKHKRSIENMLELYNIDVIQS